jgi:hypothetical protein
VAKSPSPKRKTGPGSPARFKGVPRGPSPHKQRVVARAIRAASLAGNVDRVELTPDGRINIILARQAPVTDDKANPWDKGPPTLI